MVYIRHQEGLAYSRQSTRETAIFIQGSLKKRLKIQAWGAGRGAWSVKRPALGFGLGCDLGVVRSSPASGSTLRTESA